ncbi:21291_t:CDS:2, partial [Gigaspora rosea]
FTKKRIQQKKRDIAIREAQGLWNELKEEQAQTSTTVAEVAEDTTEDITKDITDDTTDHMSKKRERQFKPS